MNVVPHLNYVLFIISFLSSCGSPLVSDVYYSGKQSDLDAQITMSQTIFDDIHNVLNLHVYYQEDIGPYTGKLGLGPNNTWDITKNSLKNLFKPTVYVKYNIPSSLEEMKSFKDRGIVKWSISNLEDLAKDYAKPLTTNDNHTNLNVFILPGVYEKSNKILGLHITGSNSSFIFKDVVKSVGGDDSTQKYVEQTTIVHEIGHTIGLVNNGINMYKDHESLEKPHHTQNPNCAMYWKVESTHGALELAQNYLKNGDLNLYKKEVIQDIEYFNTK